MPWNRSVIGPWDRQYADVRNRTLGGSWQPGFGPARIVKGAASGFEGLIAGVFNGVQQASPATVYPGALGPVDGTGGAEKWVLFHFDVPAPADSFISGWIDYPGLLSVAPALDSLTYDGATTDWDPATVTWATRPVAAVSMNQSGGPAVNKVGSAAFPILTAFGITPDAALDMHNARGFCSSIVYGLRIRGGATAVLSTAIIDQFFWNHSK